MKPSWLASHHACASEPFKGGGVVMVVVMEEKGGGGYPARYAIIRVFPRYSIRIHPLTEALPHFLTGGCLSLYV